MDVLRVFVQYGAASRSILTVQDVAVMKCISQDANSMVKLYIDDVKGAMKSIVDNTALTLGIPCKEKHVINMEMLVKQVLTVRRLYGNKQHKTKFLQVLDNFTRHILSNIWTEPLAMLSKEKQTETIHLLLRCFAQDNPEQNVLTIYVLMCFIFKVIKSNKTIIYDKDKCVFAHSKIKRIIIDKCIELTSVLREEVSSYPFMFTDRVIRRVGDVKRLVSSLL
jgi:hypothetical protein